MKYLSLFLSLCMVFMTYGCTMQTKTETKVESTIAKIDDEKKMSVHFIDVGQGDSIFIQSPDGKTMLIDGGTRESGKQVVSYLRGQGVKHLDYVVATHPDADHIGGLLAVLNSISIKRFVDSGRVHTSQTYEQLLQFVLDKNIPFTVPTIEDEIPFDSNMDVTVLNAAGDANDNNEASIVLKVKYEDVSFLLTGDADVKIEEAMMEKFDVQSTFLKAGHHGSDTSSSAAFIREVDPKVTILSYGKDNAYGHPKKEVVKRLNSIESQIYATAEVGSILVETDGENYEVFAEGNQLKQQKNKQVSSPPVIISSKDLQEEIVGITNKGESPINLKGWKLVSVEGSQSYTFPNIRLNGGKTIYITSGPNAKEGQSYLTWTKRQIWKNDGDGAVLMNEKGEVISEVQ